MTVRSGSITTYLLGSSLLGGRGWDSLLGGRGWDSLLDGCGLLSRGGLFSGCGLLSGRSSLLFGGGSSGGLFGDGLLFGLAET